MDGGKTWWRGLCGLTVALVTHLSVQPAHASDGERGSRRGFVVRRPSSVEATSGPRLSQYLHQAPAGRFELTPGLALYYSSLSRPTGSRETRFGHPLGASAEYGFSPFFSLAFHLLWDSSSASKCAANGNCVNTKSSGFFDPNADLKFHTRLGVGTIAFGANVSYAVEKYQLQNSGDDTNATGGSAITAFVGFEWPLAGGIAGAKFTDDVYKGDRQADQAGTSYTVSGGNTFSLAGFYEKPVGGIVYGGAASYLSSRSRSGYRADTGQVADYDDAFMQLSLKGYALYAFSPAMHLLPSMLLIYDKFDNGSTFYQLQGGADLRLSF